MADWIDDIGRLDGPERLAEYRLQANELAPRLQVKPEALKRTNAKTTFRTSVPPTVTI